jgi:hypothetical protein
MAKLKLQPDPTFKAKVAIQAAGEEGVDPVEFTFKHRTRDEVDEFLKASADLRDAGLIMEVAIGWELSDAFTAENINKLAQNYITAPRTIVNAYIDELVKAREKN